ncbi:MAG: hypothetical protein Ct9H300mP32_4290 [Verrucomicrobiota bacterium]|nr:MAG: hypothetical protein Ct9H300mP32_4290 [Verrucomicrobiota bacterium]
MILATGFDFVVDAIDNVANKALLIAACRERGIQLITSGAAGGRRDGTRAEVADLANSTNDPLLSKVRAQLRKEYGFSPVRERRWVCPAFFRQRRRCTRRTTARFVPVARKRASWMDRLSSTANGGSARRHS